MKNRLATLTTVVANVLASSVALAGGGPAKASASSDDAGLNKDIDVVLAQVKSGVDKNISRTTFLGWTAGNEAVFRTLICDGDALGGRGPYCIVASCIAKPLTSELAPPAECKEEISTSLLSKDTLNVGDITKEYRADVAALAPVAMGSALKISNVKLSFKKLTASLTTTNNSKPIVLFQSNDGDGRAEGVGKAKLYTVSKSPDAKCIAVIGIASRTSHYESVGGQVPVPLGAVVCNGPIAPAPAKPAAATALHESLDRDDVSAGIKSVSAKAAACGSKSTVKGMVKLSVKVGADGVVTNVTVVNTPDPVLGACVATEVRAATFAKTKIGGTFSYPFTF
jgi:hypothetical protein